MRPADALSRFFFPDIDEKAADGPALGARRDVGLFDFGPIDGLQRRAGLMAGGRLNLATRALLAIGFGWLPLLVMTAMQSLSVHDGSLMSFLTDYGVQARQLIAVPLLIVAEAVCAPRLSAIASHFEQAALIAPGDMPAFRSTVASTLRLRDSTRLEIALLAAAATIALFLMFNVPTYTFPAWHRLHVGIDVAMSPAGWWHGSVSVWILMILLLSWSWRLLLWARFLFLVSRMNLRLIAAHPDHAAGLRFTGISSQAFSVLAFALSTIVAGAAANRVMHDGAVS
jgi:hypothetical protein